MSFSVVPPPPRDGTYSGSFTGTRFVTKASPSTSDGSLGFTVQDGSITVTMPGAGSVRWILQPASRVSSPAASAEQMSHAHSAARCWRARPHPHHARAPGYAHRSARDRASTPPSAPGPQWLNGIGHIISKIFGSVATPPPAQSRLPLHETRGYKERGRFLHERSGVEGRLKKEKSWRASGLMTSRS